MAEPGLYICDLDGTLLRSDATLSDFARNGLNQLIDAGVCLTVASARGTAGMRSLLTGVRLQLPVIELNGAFISEMQSGRHVASSVLSQQDACAALKVILSTGVDPVISTWDGRRDRVHFGSRTNDSTSWYVEEKRRYRDPRLMPCDDLLAIANAEAVAQITTFTPDREAAALTDRVRSSIGAEATVHSAGNVYWPGWTEITIQHRAAEKGAAVPALLEACDAVGTDVIACGDHLNDLGLFAAATHSIAPANAHP
ncbi:MAG TPA: HAD family hydrolase, partial [Solirubrobacterales bacterium]|nr:HAD family hydrolase [Solirubrobacterales bacterium]